MSEQRSPSPAHQLAQQHLKSKFLYGTVKPDVLQRAVLAYGAGIDHFSGERVVAVMDDSEKNMFSLGVILTDRRILQRFAPQGSKQVSYEAMTPPVNVNNSAITNRFVEVTAQGEAQRMVMQHAKPVGQFLEGLMALPPKQRVPAPTPLLSPSEKDPTGGRGAYSLAEDYRAQTLLAAVVKRYEAGDIDTNQARALAGKAMLLQRTWWYGRGMRDQLWTTTLGQGDMVAILDSLFGEPVNAMQDEAGDSILTYQMGGGGRQAAKAAASSAAGMAAGALLGFGWVSVPGKRIKEVYLRIRDQKHVTGYKLFAQFGNKAMPAAEIFQDGIGPQFANAISNTLLSIEARLLLAQVLGTYDRAAMNAQTERLFGQPYNLDPFFS